ncbi:hypothetical protein [Streptomyces sp. NPDC050704]|uniref:hypothetical protein n=1 Tax=Streptomyces sp. NPDC050704 TaxID=3157219 RepID=UPI003416ED56
MTLLRRLLFGITAGLPGGAIVAVVTNPSWIPWAAHTVVLGAVLGLLFGEHRQSNGSAFSVGLFIGLLDWVTWTLTLAPMLEGKTPSWTIAVAVSRFPELVGAILFGAIAGLTFHALSTWRPPRPAPQRAKQPPPPVMVFTYRSASVTGELITVGGTVIAARNAWVES